MNPDFFKLTNYTSKALSEMLMEDKNTGWFSYYVFDFFDCVRSQYIIELRNKLNNQTYLNQYDSVKYVINNIDCNTNGRLFIRSGYRIIHFNDMKVENIIWTNAN